MRIYQVNIEEKEGGRNWDSQKIAASSFAEALKKVKLKRGNAIHEQITDVRLLEATD